MTREKYIKNLIKERGYTIKDFADKINMPYTTLLTILNRSLGGASVDNVIKICKNLDITVEDMEAMVPIDINKKQVLLENFYKLNDLGKDEAIKKIKGLVNILVDEEDSLNKLENLSTEDFKLLQMYNQLDVEDKAEIRGEMKQMLKSSKYSNKIGLLNLHA